MPKYHLNDPAQEHMSAAAVYDRSIHLDLNGCCVVSLDGHAVLVLSSDDERIDVPEIRADNLRDAFDPGDPDGDFERFRDAARRAMQRALDEGYRSVVAYLCDGGMDNRLAPRDTLSVAIDVCLEFDNAFGGRIELLANPGTFGGFMDGVAAEKGIRRMQACDAGTKAP